MTKTQQAYFTLYISTDYCKTQQQWSCEKNNTVVNKPVKKPSEWVTGYDWIVYCMIIPQIELNSV